MRANLNFILQFAVCQRPAPEQTSGMRMLGVCGEAKTTVYTVIDPDHVMTTSLSARRHRCHTG
jgi:hypothetical protein